jgi:PHD/YefM family antitoxin component YafN of YafNO toxin-antitoxin module
MATVPQNKETLANFTREPNTTLKAVEKAGAPLVLTVRGKARYVIHDVASYRKLLEALDRAESIAGIRAGMKDVAAGRTKRIADFRTEQIKKHGL